MRQALKYAVDNDRRSVTLTHKGNIMKYTEGAFRNGATARRERVRGKLLGGPGLTFTNPHRAWIVVKDVIADAFLQQILLRPGEYDVIATMNLNGDYISDAPPRRLVDRHRARREHVRHGALFEATHGTAPKYAGQDKVNPGSLILGRDDAPPPRLEGGRRPDHLVDGAAVGDKQVTYDFARLMDGASEVSRSAFGQAMIDRMQPGACRHRASGFSRTPGLRRSEPRRPAESDTSTGRRYRTSRRPHSRCSVARPSRSPPDAASSPAADVEHGHARLLGCSIHLSHRITEMDGDLPRPAGARGRQHLSREAAEELTAPGSRSTSDC